MDEEQTEPNPFYETWGWYNVIDDLASGDRTKYDYYFRMPAFDLLNHISFVMDKKEMKNAATAVDNR